MYENIPLSLRYNCVYIIIVNLFAYTVKPVLSGHSKKTKIGFQDQLSLNVGQKYCRMLQGEHSAILSTFIKLPFVVKAFVLSIFVWPFYTGFTVSGCMRLGVNHCFVQEISTS